MGRELRTRRGYPRPVDAPRWTARLVRPHDAHLLALDFAAAVVLTALYVGFIEIGRAEGQLGSYQGPVWLGWLVACGVGGPIAIRRRWPVTVLAIVLLSSTAATLLDLTREPYLALGLAAYLVALARPMRVSALVLAVALIGSGAAVLLGEAVVTPTETWSGAVGVVAMVWLVVIGAWSAGYVVRGRRVRAAAEEAGRARRAVLDERLRIARELHDIVSHSLGLIAVTAGVANHVAAARPEQAAEALRTIEETSRTALTEMRSILGLLRTESAAAPSESERLVPVPRLDQLPALARHAGQAGVDVELDVRVAEGLLSEGMELTVHRIVQEALTNVVKHAPGSRCHAVVEADRQEVRIDIADTGTARERRSRAVPGGHGLIGMRERVMMYGGTLSAGPRADGGFAVSVRLPCGPAVESARSNAGANERG